MRTCFTKFSKSFYIKFFLRKKLFKFFKEIKKNNETIFIVTANYQDLVKVFLEENDIYESSHFKIVGTKLPKKDKPTHEKILKGKIKLRKILQIIRKKNIETNNVNIYNFFDSYDDKYLCMIAKYNNLISIFNLKKMNFFKKNYNAIFYNDFLKNIQ